MSDIATTWHSPKIICFSDLRLCSSQPRSQNQNYKSRKHLYFKQAIMAAWVFCIAPVQDHLVVRHTLCLTFPTHGIKLVWDVSWVIWRSGLSQALWTLESEELDHGEVRYNPRHLCIIMPFLLVSINSTGHAHTNGSTPRSRAEIRHRSLADMSFTYALCYSFRGLTLY